MDKSTLLKGESKTLEFKAALSSKSESYLKTVVAFANTDGGRLIFGIDDKSRQVIGVEKDDVFKIMDAIANAVSDSCAPKIVPDMSFETIEDKTVVLVDIAAENSRVFHHVSGTYIGAFAHDAVSTHHGAYFLPYLRTENGTA